MRWTATLTNGDRWHVDTDTRTVTADPANGGGPLAALVGPVAENLLASGEPIGPQVDEFVGIRGDWGHPRAPLAAVLQAAREANVRVLAWEPDRVPT